MTLSPKVVDLKPLFEPRSIAIVGASGDARRQGGGLVFKFLKQHKYGGTIYPVNPKYNEVDSRKCYPSLASIGEPIDLAVLAVPAGAVVETIAGVPENQVKFALVLSSGFSEIGATGTDLERKLITIARRKGISVVGPNVVGVVNLWNGVVPTISQYFDRDVIVPGDVALISQSGAFGTAILAQAEQAGIRFGYFVSSGNESDLEFSDYGRFLVEDERVKVICGYLEGVSNGPAFVDFARRATEAGKPVIVLKVGSSATGAQAARSHTGALVGSDAVTQAIFDAHNIIRATDGENLVDLLKVFTKTPSARGKRLAILSHSGGAGVMATDAAESGGAVLNPLPDDLRERLAQMLPPFASVDNPLDMTGGASLQGKLMADCLRTVLEHEAYDAALLCVNLIWREGPVLVRELDTVSASVSKPFAVSWVAPNKEISNALRDAPYPVFSDPARAARTLVRRLAYDEQGRQAPCRSSREPVPRERERVAPALTISIADQAEVLRTYGIPLPRQTVAKDVKEAETFRDMLKSAVAVKIASPDIAHRTEIGAVVTDINDAAALVRAYEKVVESSKRHFPNARIDGALVQEMIGDGVEAFIGIKRDNIFGPILAFGPGGMLVEFVRKVQMRPLPMSPADIDNLVHRSSLYPLLTGYRGTSRLDIRALVEIITRICWLVDDYPELGELDLNPVVVLPEGQGCVVLDYKFSLTE